MFVSNKLAPKSDLRTAFCLAAGHACLSKSFINESDERVRNGEKPEDSISQHSTSQEYLPTHLIQSMISEIMSY